jgi:ferredoxin
MKILVNSDLCTGHGRCHAVAATLYQLDPDGFCTADGMPVELSQRDMAEHGANACPEAAISLEG